jgi:hypothetical protein
MLSPALAPKAARMPSSRLRSAAKQAMSVKLPKAAIAKARAPMPLKMDPADFQTRSSGSANADIGDNVGCQPAGRLAPARAITFGRSRGPLAASRMKSTRLVICSSADDSGTYSCNVGRSTRLSRRISRTTPTTTCRSGNVQ